MWFIGVTTGASLSHRFFPNWTRALGLEADCRLVGIDLPLGASSEDYRQVIKDLRDLPGVHGALITSHKISLMDASCDLFDQVDETSAQAGEVGCITARGGRLTALALDPMTSSFAMDEFVPSGHWAEHPGSRVLCLGAGEREPQSDSVSPLELLQPTSLHNSLSWIVSSLASITRCGSFVRRSVDVDAE